MAAVVIIVCTILLSILFARILWIYTISRKHKCIRMDGYNLFETQLKQAPFSFLNNLFWRQGISVCEETGERIFNHELAHIRGKHTYDKLFSQLVVCVFWMNPFYWIIKKELNMIHEFIADAKAIKDGDTGSFAKMLLWSYDEGNYLNPAHSFFHSPAKRRLMMLTAGDKDSRSVWPKVSILLVIPFIIIACSFTIENGKLRDKRNGMLVNKLLQQDLAGLTENNTNIRKVILKILNDPPDIVYYVNNAASTKEQIKQLKIENITSFRVLRGEMAAKQYGEKARSGVVALTIQ
jgi:hypothetical protein